MTAVKKPTTSLQLQERDFTLLRGLFECRVMTRAHIGLLYFDGKQQYAKKRLQQLKSEGLVSERTRRMNEPSVHFLTRKAFALLNSEGRLSDYPPLGATTFEARANVKESTLNHELDVMNVKASFHAALANSPTFSIVEFSTWPLLYQFETTREGRGGDRLMKPDGFIRLHEKEDGSKGFFHECFLEVDRSSEVQETLVEKALCYAEYYRSGGFAVRNGAERSAFKDYRFRVLMVFRTAERRNNTAERLAQSTPRILTQVWLTTLAEATTNPLGPIWIVPADYRSATEGTAYYNEQPNRRFEYRRRPDREAFVEANIRKLCVLTGKPAPLSAPNP